MLKVRMLARHNGEIGKMEKGLEYLLPRSYAFELVNHGLAEFVPIAPPVNVTLGPPSKTMAMETALKELRAKNQRQIRRKKDK